MNKITLQQEDQTVKNIVDKLNDLVDRHNLFIEAGRIVYEEIQSLGTLEYGEQARIIRKVAEYPNLKYSPNQVKEAFNTIRKFPKLLGGSTLLLPAYHYEVLATSRLNTEEINKFEKEAIEKKWSQRQLKQAIGAYKAENQEDYPEWLQYGNCWKFSGCDPRMGLEGHPGRIPGQITLNLLHYYTEENDLFVSAFGGSGTDIDACKMMKRNCIAFDLNPVRKDIKKADLTMGIPLEKEVADFVFFDPPWLSAQKDKYSGNKMDLANLQFEDFYQVMDNLAQEANRILKTYKYCGIICANMPGWGEIHFEDVGFKLNEIFSKYFQPTQRISIPYPTNMVGGGGAAFQISRARKEKYMLAAFADLLIFKKV
jgi:hypothetical protein